MSSTQLSQSIKSNIHHLQVNHHPLSIPSLTDHQSNLPIIHDDNDPYQNHKRKRIDLRETIDNDKEEIWSNSISRIKLRLGKGLGLDTNDIYTNENDEDEDEDDEVLRIRNHRNKNGSFNRAISDSVVQYNMKPKTATVGSVVKNHPLTTHADADKPTRKSKSSPDAEVQNEANGLQSIAKKNSSAPLSREVAHLLSSSQAYLGSSPLVKAVRQISTHNNGQSRDGGETTHERLVKSRDDAPKKRTNKRLNRLRDTSMRSIGMKNDRPADDDDSHHDDREVLGDNKMNEQTKESQSEMGKRELVHSERNISLKQTHTTTDTPQKQQSVDDRKQHKVDDNRSSELLLEDHVAADREVLHDDAINEMINNERQKRLRNSKIEKTVSLKKIRKQSNDDANESLHHSSSNGIIGDEILNGDLFMDNLPKTTGNENPHKENEANSSKNSSPFIKEKSSIDQQNHSDSSNDLRPTDVLKPMTNNSETMSDSLNDSNPLPQQLVIVNPSTKIITDQSIQLPKPLTTDYLSSDSTPNSIPQLHINLHQLIRFPSTLEKLSYQSNPKSYGSQSNYSQLYLTHPSLLQLYNRDWSKESEWECYINDPHDLSEMDDNPKKIENPVDEMSKSALKPISKDENPHDIVNDDDSGMCGDRNIGESDTVENDGQKEDKNSTAVAVMPQNEDHSRHDHDDASCNNNNNERKESSPCDIMDVNTNNKSHSSLINDTKQDPESLKKSTISDLSDSMSNDPIPTVPDTADKIIDIESCHHHIKNASISMPVDHNEPVYYPNENSDPIQAVLMPHLPADDSDTISRPQDDSTLKSRPHHNTINITNHQEVMKSQQPSRTIEVKALLSQLNCSLCSNLLCDAVVMSCSHAFCWCCIELSLRRNQLYCPSCHTTEIIRSTTQYFCPYVRSEHLDNIIYVLLQCSNDNDRKVRRTALKFSPPNTCVILALIASGPVRQQ
jgi:hypothetical protein